jgi:MFS family permease
MVALSLGVTASAFIFINGVAFLIPALEAERGTPLAEAGLLSSMPSWGMVTTLFVWGYLLDRFGERIVLAAGSALTAAAAYGAASVHSLLAISVFLFLGGMAAASCNSAGGRLVSGWFPPHQRGLAMGIRQTAQPVGIALGAVIIPELAERSTAAGLMFPALACTVSAVAAGIGVVEPPRKSPEAASDEELSNPYRRTSVLRRIHAASALLMMPQTMTVTFMLVWLINNHGWQIESAGVLVTVSQLLGALGRVIAGRWSDRVGSRLRPVRTVAVAGGLALLLLAFTDHQGWAIAVELMIIASVIAALDNGLESVAITEYAGPFWSGRALGAQNTFQRLAAAAGPPLFGAVITAAGYPAAFALCGLFPLAAAPLVPASVVPPGLEIRARWQSVRRYRRWNAVRSLDLPEISPPLDQRAWRRRLRRREKAARPRT